MVYDKARFFTRDGEFHFCLLNNHLDGYKATDEEKKKAKQEGLTNYFQLFDDDHILYYSGYDNFDLMYENDEDEFTILDMAMYESGCTINKTRGEDGKMHVV